MSDKNSTSYNVRRAAGYTVAGLLVAGSLVATSSLVFSNAAGDAQPQTEEPSYLVCYEEDGQYHIANRATGEVFSDDVLVKYDAPKVKDDPTQCAIATYGTIITVDFDSDYHPPEAQ